MWFLGLQIGIFFLIERPTQYFLQMLFLSFRHFRNILYIPVGRRDKETHSCDEGNKTCRRLGVGSRGDREQKSCTIFKIANNEGGEWRERQRQSGVHSDRSAADPGAGLKRYLVPQLEIQLFKLKLREQHKRAIHADFFTN